MRTFILFLLTLLPLSAQITMETAFRESGVSGFTVEDLPTPTDLLNDSTEETDYGAGVAVFDQTVAVGAPVVDDFDSNSPGVVYIFQRSDAGWSQLQKLEPSDVTSRMKFGTSLDFSENGEWLAIGTDDRRQRSGVDRIPGGCYIYRRNATTQRYEIHQKIANRPVQNRFGFSVRVSHDWLGILDISQQEVVMFQWNEQSSCWLEKQTIEPQTPGQLRVEGSFDLDGPILALLPYQGSGTWANLFHLDSANGSWVSETNIEAEGFSEALHVQGNRLLIPQGFSGHSISGRSGTPGIPSPDSNPWSLLGQQGAFDNFSVSAALQDNLFLGIRPNDELSEVPPRGIFLSLYDSNSNIWSTPEEAANFNSGFMNPVVYSSPDLAVLRVQEGFASTSKISALIPNETNLIQDIRRKLFYADGQTIEEQNAAAFAYEVRLFASNDSGDPVNLKDDFITRHSEIDIYYDTVNRNNAAAANTLLRELYPSIGQESYPEIEPLFLDLAYGQMAAELIRSKEQMLTLNQARINGTDGTLYFLNAEITIIEEALEKSTAALNAYLPLLSDSLGVPAIDGDPAGRSIFARYVPTRALGPSRDETGASVNGSEDDIIESHKDIVLVYDAMLHHTRSVSELIWLLIARNETGDFDQASRLIGDTKRLVFEQRVLLDALFPELAPIAAEDNIETLRDRIGFTELADGIDSALADLTAFEQNLNGTINLLGYEPDFLMLIQSTGSAFDSFESFKAILEDESTSSSGQKLSRLGRAAQAQTDAADAIDNYGRTQDALEQEWTRLADSSIIPRLFDIVGVNPGESGYDTPETNTGSEIQQQFQSIEVARLRIARNKAEISNLRQKVSIEQSRRARESEINSEISDLIVEYGDKQAKITEQIGAIEAAQAAADNIADIFSPEKILTGAVIAGVVNAAVQAGGEVGKAYLEGDKEQLAAEQDSMIRDKEDQILGANSAALIQTILLEMNTLAIDSQEAAVLLRQEAGRLTALYCEKANLERRLDEVSDQLSSRYFADPVHRLRTVADTLEADIRFEDARRWLFFATRALEYRWNEPINQPSGLAPDGFWNIDDLFKMRNAEELTRFFNGLLEWNDSTQRPNRLEEPKADFFSLREDFFGYDENDDLTGNPIFYDAVNPGTGDIENVDAITAFRYELAQLIQECDDDSNLELCIPFDTVRRNNYQSNLGEYDGNLFTPNDYLNRIETVRVFIKGNHEKLGANDTSNTARISLTYAGTSFIRTPVAGTPGPDGDRIIGELTAYPTRFYRASGSDGKFTFEEGLTDINVIALKTSRERDERSDFAVMPTEEVPGVLPQAIRIFRERSVATTGWLLNVRIGEGANPDNDLDPNEIDDILLRIDHRAVAR